MASRKHYEKYAALGKDVTVVASAVSGQHRTARDINGNICSLPMKPAKAERIAMALIRRRYRS